MGSPSIAEINPKTDLKEIKDDGLVSFIPMEFITEKINAFTHTSRLISEVRKGYTCFQNDDVLWAKITPCMQNGKTAVVQGLTNGVGFGSTEFHVVRSKADSLSRFLWAVLSMPRLLYAAQGAFTGSSGHQRVPASFLEQLEIPVPPLDVQRRLITELDAARIERDQALAQADEAISGFEEWALKAMGIVAIQPKRRSTFAVRIGSVRNRLDPFHHLPEFIGIERAITSAPHARLGDLVTFSTDTWNPVNHSEPTFRYIEISGVDRRRGKAIASAIATDEAPSRARMAVQPGDLIVSLTRPHHGSIALLGPEHQDCVASTGFAVIRNVTGKSSARFLWAVLRLSSSLRQMLRRASGGNYPAITQDELANILVPLPDINTQQRVIDEAVRRSMEADALEAKAEAVWQQARQRFEQQLLKGDAT
ncbi:MAG: restriction endonuclease subunit S [Proteobacteria bacterium]|nr:restriction endonuclease subunit S [Pseudomonadota bacterium]